MRHLFILFVISIFILPSCNKNKAQAYYSIAREYSILLHSEKIERNQETIDKVIFYYEKALKMEPTNPNIYASFAFFLMEEKIYDKGTEVYNTAFKLKPKEALFHNNYAWLLATSEDENFFDPKKAVHHAELAIKYYKEQEDEKLYSSMIQLPNFYDTLAKAEFENIRLLRMSELSTAKSYAQKAYEAQLKAIEIGKEVNIVKSELENYYKRMDFYLEALKKIQKEIENKETDKKEKQ